MGFQTEGFWRQIILMVLILGVIFFVINVTLLKKSPKKQKIQGILINVFLGIGVFFLFYKIYHVIPEVLNPKQFFTQNVINNILYVCVLALSTTAIVLIFKTSITANFAQGMIATFGAFTAAKLVMYLSSTYTSMGDSTIIVLAMIGSALTAFLLGIIIEVFIIRKSKLPSPIGKQMITMGLVLVFTGAMPLIFGTVSMSIPRLTYADNIVFTLFGMNLYITANALLSLIITVVLLAILFSVLRFTKLGLGVRATASNENVANMMGVNTRMITALGWAIAGLLGGVAAVMLAPTYSTLGVSLLIPTQVNGFMAAILGCFSSFAGPLLASILIPIMTGLLTFVVTGWQNAVVYLIILVIVLVKPLGLFGKPIAKKV